MKRLFIIASAIFILVMVIFLFSLIPAFGSIKTEEADYLPMLVKPSTCIYPTEVPWPPPPEFTPTPGGPVPTPPPPPTPVPSPCGDVRITEIHYAGSGSQEPGEYVEIKNSDDLPILLQDWTLTNGANQLFLFPSYVLIPGKNCRIYTNEHHPEWCGFSFGSANPIWSNDGDCPHLFDSSGNPVIGFCY